MHTFLKIIYFILGCVFALYLVGAMMAGPGALSASDGAGFAFAFGLIAAIVFWPVTLVLLGVGIWLVFLRGGAR